jgi:hypothetical protein
MRTRTNEIYIERLIAESEPLEAPTIEELDEYADLEELRQMMLQEDEED